MFPSLLRFVSGQVFWANGGRRCIFVTQNQLVMTATAQNTISAAPFSNVQLEILKTFSFQLEDEQLLRLRKMLATFFAQIAIEEANKTWDKKGWTDETAAKMMETKMRKRRTQKI